MPAIPAAALPAFVPEPLLKPRLRHLLPREHGSWAMLGEPLLLGLLVFPGRTSGMLAVVFCAVFLLRPALKASLDPRLPAAERRFAAAATAIFAALAVTLLLIVYDLTTLTRLWPLAAALPFAALFAYFDFAKKTRELAPETLGAATFAIAPAALASVQGASLTAALALSFFAAARSLPTLLIVRAYLRRNRSSGALCLGLGLATSLVCVPAAAMLHAHGLAPLTAAACLLILAARAMILHGPSAPNLSARQCGMIEAALGLFITFTVGLTWR